jgi:hypothetical protein
MSQAETDLRTARHLLAFRTVASVNDFNLRQLRRRIAEVDLALKAL